MKTRYEDTRFNKRIRITEADYEWIKKNKGKKSAAGFLEHIIKQAREGEKKNDL
jgi:hypothetical protein